MTDYQTLGGSNNRLLFLTILKPGKYKIKVPADLRSRENLLPGILTGQRAEKEQGYRVSSYQDTNPIHQGSTPRTLSPPKVLPPNTTTLGPGISNYDFEGGWDTSISVRNNS